MNNTPLNIVFMGTPEFAVPSLDILIQNQYNIRAVVTIPDKPAGRGKKLTQSAVKQYALEHHLPILQPEKLRDPDFIDSLRKLQPDLFIVVAFRMLPEIIWEMPSIGTFNLHGSLLPQFRGAAPINHAIITGQKETGVTTFFLNHEIDTGKIILRERISIDDEENAGDLHDKMMSIGANAVLKTVKAIEANNYTLTSQEDISGHDTGLKPAPKIFKQHCALDWNEQSLPLKNKIRGLAPYPAAYTRISGPNSKSYMLKIYKVEIINPTTHEKPGTIRTDGKNFMHIASANGWLNILELQLEGKKKMAVTDFLRGFHPDNEWKAS